ncbi:hypothetical protein ABZ845_10095 [Streptomyces sp. NPDC047022]|uniref:hypothetical protein n=1 Tax=Streptomyces sp. NPDC047022 TaxID=3155737 RepID=UPI0033CABB69
MGTFASPPAALTIMLAWPVMTVVAAAHSPDIVGLSRKRAWLWTPGSSWLRSWWN